MTAKRRAVWVILGLAAAALVVDPVRIHPKRVRTLQPVAPGQAVFPPGGFVDAGVYPSLNGTPLFDALPTRGSWAGSDGFEGEYRTSWLVPRAGSCCSSPGIRRPRTIGSMWNF